nr:hypothetical protein [Arenivirga flava]
MTSSATTPPTAASRLRTKGPPSGSGSSITIIDCVPAASTKAELAVRKRSSASTESSTTAICHVPLPMSINQSSVSTMPMRMPPAVSMTRRGRASRLSPSAVIVVVTASSGMA